MIEARNVSKVYELGVTQVHALRGVSLKIDEGDFVVIAGRSGSVKSTLMHILGALDLPTKGSVFIDGHDITKMDDWGLAMLRRKRIGFVFQEFNLIPTLTALENVLIPTQPMKVDEDIVRERALKILGEVGLGNRVFHKPNELSGGQRQRVSIARALINDPKIIFADEPTGNLDSVTGNYIVGLMRHLNKVEKKTFVIVTHDESLLGHASKQVFLFDGKIVDEKVNKKFRG